MFERWLITLRTFTSVCGQSVFDVNTGNELGRIEDLFINKEGQVIGFQLDQKGFLHGDCFIPIEAITGFGQDGLMMRDKKQLCQLVKAGQDVYPLKQGKNRISGKAIMTEEGEKLGLLEDVYFLEEVGTIVGYEVTEGLLADIKEGKKVIKAKEPLTIGKDILVIQV